MLDEIKFDQSLRLSIQTSLRAAFNQPLLELTSAPNRGSHFTIAISNPDTTASDVRYEHALKHVIDPNGKDTNFYFGFTGAFGQRAPRCLHHASLVVFCHVGFQELLPVIRAEWDAIAATDESKHAQPHWHFVQTPEYIERIVRTLSSDSFDFAPDAPDSIFSERPIYEQCHFAMASLTDATKGHKETFNDATFKGWFRNMTRYVGEQVMYVADKSPDLVREFAAD
jgi:hypothetical protein